MKNLFLLFVLPLSILGQNKGFNMDYFNKLNEQERSIVDKGTEAPFSGEYNNFLKRVIIFVGHVKRHYINHLPSLILIVAGLPLMMNENAIIKTPDNSYNMQKLKFVVPTATVT